jgi:hypothetical protein
LGELTGIKNIGEHAKGALEQVRHLGEGLLEMAGPLAALGAAGSVAGLVEIAKSTGEFAEKLALASGKTGIATEQLAGWHYAAGLVNVDIDQFDRGLMFLNRNISEAAAGKAKDLQNILHHMGFSNTPAHLVNTADGLKAVAAEVKHLSDGGQIQLATDMMAKLFGERQGAQLLPLFEQGPEKIAEILKEAKENGVTMTDAQAAAGLKFEDSYKAMEASVMGLKIAIGTALMPALTPAIEGMREFLNDHRAEIARDLGRAVGYISAELKGITWDNVKADIKEFGGDVKWVIDKIGGIGPAIAIVGTFTMAPTIMEFLRLGGTVGKVATQFVLFPVAALIADFAKALPAIRDMKGAMAALSAAMDANPIGVVIIGAALVAAAAYEIIENWKPIEAFFGDLWKNVVAHFHDAWGEIKPIVDSIDHAVSWVGNHLPGGGGAVIDGMPLGPPLSALPGAAAAAGGGAQGETKVTVDFKNLPPGATVSTESRGSASAPDVNVGPAMGMVPLGS